MLRNHGLSHEDMDRGYREAADAESSRGGSEGSPSDGENKLDEEVVREILLDVAEAVAKHEKVTWQPPAPTHCHTYPHG